MLLMKSQLKRSFMLFSLLTCLFPSCGKGQVQNGAYSAMLKTLLGHTVTETSVKDVQASPNALLLDARTSAEYKVSHLKNSVFVGFNDFDLGRLPQNTPKDQPIIVYCSVGYRSEKVSEQLQKAGYTNVKNLVGGIFEWKNAGGKVYNNAGETENVHAYNRTWGIWLQKGKKVY